MKLELISRRATTRTKYPPVVFVHGGFHAAWCWDEHFLPYFCGRGLDVFAFSLRGHGQSDGREELDRWGLTDFCDDLAQVCGTLSEPPILVGHSIGTVIVQRYVQDQSAAAMVLIAPTPLASMPLKKLRWAVRFPLTTVNMIIRRDINCSLPALRHLFFSPDMPRHQINEYMSRMQRESNRVFRDIARIRKPNPAAVQIPSLILAAEQDRIPARVNESLASAFCAELQTLPMAHDVMLTPKWEMVAARIVEWIMNSNTTIGA